MEAITSTIGMEIAFDEMRYNRAVRNWQLILFPAITSVAEEYQALGLGNLNQQVYNSVITTGIKDIRQAYTAALTKEMAKTGSKLLNSKALNEVDENMQPLKAKIETLKAKQWDAQGMTLVDHSLPIEWDDCIIIDGRPKLNLEKLRERFALVIETKSQQELWDRLNRVKNEWDGLAAFLTVSGYDTASRNIFSPNSNYGLVNEIENGELFINPYAINNIK